MNAPAFDPASLAQALAAGFLLVCRLLPVAWLAPFALVAGAPASLALSLCALLAICVWPAALAHAPLLPTALPSLLALSLRELLLGSVYALALALPLRALEWGGALQGRFSGLPGAEQPLATLQLWLALAAFFALGGQRLAVQALAHSVTQQPLGKLAPLADLPALAMGSVQLIGDAFALAVQVGLPVAAALGLAELAMALLARTTEAGWIAPLHAPARSLLALFVIWIATRALLDNLPESLRRGMAVARRLWETL